MLCDADAQHKCSWMATADASITNNRLLENYPQKSQITDGADWETSERLQLAGKKAKRKILFFPPSLVQSFQALQIFQESCQVSVFSRSCICFWGCCSPDRQCVTRSDKAACRKRSALPGRKVATAADRAALVWNSRAVLFSLLISCIGRKH